MSTTPSTFRIWVVETFHGSGPRVELYAGLELKNTGASVMIRGHKSFIRAAENRKFFIDESKVSEFCKAELEGQLRKARDRVKHFEEILEKKRLFVRHTPGSRDEDDPRQELRV